MARLTAGCVMCKTSAALVELYPFSHTVRNIIMCRIVITIPLYKNTYPFCKIILFPLLEIKRYNVNKHRKDGILEVNSLQKYKKLFSSTLKLSACTFGGGFVIIPLMRKKFVEELGWIEEDEMMDLTAIAQSSPGAIAVNASILVGYHVAGFPGAMLTVLGTILPPLMIISIISMFYQAFRDNAIVNMAMAGMLCGVAAVICDVVINMAKTILQKKRLLPVIVMLGSFAAVRFFSVNIIAIILVCGVIGAADTWHQGKMRKVGGKR